MDKGFRDLFILEKGKGQRESQADSALSPEPDTELKSYNPEITTWAEPKSWMFNQMCHAGAPKMGKDCK